MRVRHERPMSDLAFRVRAPLKLTLETGKAVVIDQWSLTGIIYPEETDILPKTGAISIPFQGVDIQFDVRFVDGTEPGEMLFDGLTGRQRETLAIFYRSILSGKMASAEDMITSLDTPVDLVPMGETEEEEAIGKAKAGNRYLRVLWNVAFYLLFATVVFGLVGGQIFGRLSHVPLQHARVVAPFINLYTSEAAFVDEILVAPGDVVTRGDTLVRLTNPEAEAALEDVREDITISDRLVEEARSRLVTHQDLRVQDRDVLRRAYLNALSRREHLNYVDASNLDDLIRAQNALKNFDAAALTKIGPSYEIERQLQLEADAAETRLSRLKRDLGNIKSSMSAGDIIAIEDGVVRSIDVFEDQFVGRGALAVTLEENAPRIAKAWLNETRSEAIYVGMPTTVRFNTGADTRSVDGTITDITAQVDPSISDEFGLVVSVAFDDMDIQETRTTFRNDAPVTLRALKTWAIKFPWMVD